MATPLLKRRGLLLAIAVCATPVGAITRNVASTAEFATALAAAQPGDSIVLAAGVYGGGHFRAGLSGVTIRGDSAAPVDSVILRGGANGLQLSDATNVTIERITFEQQTGNGLNIDDGGTFATPTTNLTLRNLTVRDMVATGNNDGIKLSGVTGFLIDGVRVFNWGAGGSAIDPVGSHQGVIQNSHFRSTVLTELGSGIRPKGGSKGIAIRGNLMELPAGLGRAMQAGGSTGAEFFRFVDGDSGYEAADISYYGNRVIGGSSAMNWVNIDGGAFHHNDVRSPGRWAMRVLNENPGTAIVDTRGGVFTDNYVAYNGATWSQAVNVGSETEAASFTFARNKWLNTASPTPAGSTPSLPAPEVGGEYGVAAPWGVGQPMRWEFAWGEWVVPLDAAGQAVAVANHREWLYARPQPGATFDPLAADPLAGPWTFRPAGAVETTAAFIDFVLIRPEDCSICSTLPGDYDRNGLVNPADAAYWAQSYGYAGDAPLADGNGDGVVDAADYTVWRDAYAAATGTTVPEPCGSAGCVVLAAGALLRRREG